MISERSAESVREGRMSEINKLHEKGVVKRWSREEAKKAGAKVFTARWVDDKFNVKSRYVIKEFVKPRITRFSRQLPTFPFQGWWTTSRRSADARRSSLT